MADPRRIYAPGPYGPSDVRPGQPWEISNGHRVACAPSGGEHGRAPFIAARALGSDPAVVSAGFDVGFALDSKTLRAPDISIGGVPDRPGFVRGVPDLGIEYASSGQDEADLLRKVEELLERGTRYMWVVRLTMPRHVVVFERNKEPRRCEPGELLDAPGVLSRPLPVEALWDADVARRVDLRNELERYGYRDLDAVRDEGKAEGLSEGKAEGLSEGEQAARAALITALQARFGDASDALAQDIATAPLRRLLSALLQVGGATDLSPIAAALREA